MFNDIVRQVYMIFFCLFIPEVTGYDCTGGKVFKECAGTCITCRDQQDDAACNGNNDECSQCVQVHS